MNRSDYVQFKKGNAYFRRRVPTELVGIIGRTEWLQSLKTQDRRVAQQRSKILENETDAQIAQAYRMLQGKPLNRDEISRFGETHFERTNAFLDTYTEEVRGDDDEFLRREEARRAPVPTAPDELAAFLANLEPEPDPDFLRNSAKLRLASLQRALKNDDYRLVYTFADAAFEQQGLARTINEPEDDAVPTGPQIGHLEIDRTRTDYQALARELMLREVDAVKRQLVQLAKAEVGWIDTPQKVYVSAPGHPGPVELAPDANKTPLQLIALFGRDSRDARGASNLRSYESAIKLLQQVTGKKAVAAITKNDVLACYNLVNSCPQKYRTRLRVETMREAIAMNADGAIPINAPATVQKFVSNLRCFFEWARERNLIAANPVGDLKVKRGKAVENDESLTYTTAELNAIFRLPPFAAPPKERGYRFWVPLVALFTGARMGEVCSLETTDVRCDAGIWWLNLFSSKTKKYYMSPVHPELIRIGFLDYAKRQQAKGGNLFPDAPIGAPGRNAYQPVSQWFAHMLTKAGLKRPGVNVHSFRHTFITACRNSGISKEIAKTLTAHASEDVHDSYGDPACLERLAEAMKTLTHKGVILSHLNG